MLAIDKSDARPANIENRQLTALGGSSMRWPSR